MDIEDKGRDGNISSPFNVYEVHGLEDLSNPVLFGNNDTNVSNYTIDSIDAVGNVEAFNNFDINEYNETQKKLTQAIDYCGNESNGDNMLINLGYHFETDEVFESREKLVETCQSIGHNLNTVVIIIKSEKASANRKGRLILGCERSGVYRDHHKKQATVLRAKSYIPRDTATRKCNCPFKLKGIALAGGMWKLQVECGNHNHEIPETLVGHPYMGRLKPDEKSIVLELSLCGVKPKQVLNALKHRDKTNMSTMKTIYNAKTRMRLAELEGRSAVQQLMKLLDEKNYVHWYRGNKISNEVEDIFWAHPKSILLTKCFPSVIMVDCTYKTNRYQMPLLQIVGVTSTSMTFCVAFALLHGERKGNYEWAFTKLRSLFEPNAMPQVFVTDRELASRNALRSVFPNAYLLLCTWHISKKVEQYCKPHFDSNDEWTKFIQQWHEVASALTEVDFNNQWGAFKHNWVNFPKCIDYLVTTWLPHKENFVLAWTNMVKHRGNTTTNRAEGTHAKLKRHLGTFQSVFAELWRHMDNLILSELNEVKASLERSKGSTRHLHNARMWIELVNQVSHYAINLMVEEMARVQYIGIDTSACGHKLRNVYGLPCAHELAQYEREGRPIPLSSIDPHWAKLSSKPNIPEYDDVDYEPEMQFFKKRWNEATRDEKRAMLKKIMEIASPATTSLVEPTPIISKGRPKRKLSNKEKKQASSTKRNPSGFEYVTLKKPTVQEFMLKNTETFLNFLPQMMRLYIERIENVEDDGNCGFRAIAGLMGWTEEKSWMKVRSDLHQEVIRNGAMYERIFGKDFHKQMVDILDCYKSPCPESNWMMMPYMGYLVASAYRVVLVFLSNDQCLTFLPFKVPPIPGIQPRLISIGLVNRVHFVKVFLKHDSPIPPIATMWTKHHTKESSGWSARYAARIETFKSMVPSKIAIIDFHDEE